VKTNEEMDMIGDNATHHLGNSVRGADDSTKVMRAGRCATPVES
jgi:hypothetical protein